MATTDASGLRELANSIARLDTGDYPTLPAAVRAVADDIEATGTVRALTRASLVECLHESPFAAAIIAPAHLDRDHDVDDPSDTTTVTTKEYQTDIVHREWHAGTAEGSGRRRVRHPTLHWWCCQHSRPRGGGMSVERAQEMVEFYGRDVVLLRGGEFHHGSREERARAMRDAAIGVTS